MFTKKQQALLAELSSRNRSYTWSRFAHTMKRSTANPAIYPFKVMDEITGYSFIIWRALYEDTDRDFAYIRINGTRYIVWKNDITAYYRSEYKARTIDELKNLVVCTILV